MNKNDILEKIKKCLALSESSNENESRDALLKAQSLMMKYHINEKLLKKDNKDADKFTKSVYVIRSKKRLMWYETYLGKIIDDNFRVIVYSSGNRENGRNLLFLGLSDDVEVAVEVFDFTLKIMMKFGKEYIKNFPEKEKSLIKNDYYRGFLMGLDKGFKEQVEKNNWGLILVKDEVVIRHAENLKLKYKKKTGIPPKFKGNNIAYNEGYKKGVETGNQYSEEISPSKLT